MATTMPSHGFRRLNPSPWLHKFRSSSSATSLSASASPFSYSIEDSEETQQSNTIEPNKPQSYFPKRGQTLELECETLAFKGKGMCKVADTGFVVMCDRALPGERFLGRVTRKKGNYAEVTKVKTISPHWDIVDAPCEYASVCGGCKTQNLSYEAQVRAKEQQVRELLIHVGKFSDKDPEFYSIMKPIVPCDIQFHYRNKMEFSFATQKWLPIELLHERQDGVSGYALGLHAPGFFDKVLNVNKCLLQSEPANMVCCLLFELLKAHKNCAVCALATGESFMQ